MACESQLAVLPTTVRVKNERNRPCTVDPKKSEPFVFPAVDDLRSCVRDSCD